MVRPRSIPDKDIIAEVYKILMEEGPSNLTFDRLGTRVGLVPAALVRRFQTKQQLIMRVDQYALERSNAKVAEAIEQAASPIDAIIAQFVTEKSFASSLENFINGEEFLLMDLRDKDLYANYHVSFLSRHRQIANLLEKAQADGELEGVKNPDELARHLQMIIHGSGHVWAMTQEGPIQDYISHHVQLALAPYRTKEGDTHDMMDGLV